MPRERMSMRHVRECLRLKSAGISTREIARRVGVASSTVRLTLQRCEAAGIACPLDAGLTDAVLEQLLFANAGVKPGHRRHAEPDWAVLHREMRRKHVTLSILWEEYITANPGGYRYSRFCELYREWEGRLPVTMRQTHAPGERLFVDYAGDGVPVVIDRLTGEIRKAQIFVAVLGASSFTFARAGWTQALPDWIDVHVHALRGDRRRSAFARAEQYQDRRHQGLPLRSAGQSNLCRDGHALRRRHFASQAKAATGQGESRAGGAHCRAVVIGAAAPPNFLQPGRGQRGDCRTDAASQRRAPDPAARRDAPAIALRDRSSGSEEPAGRTL